MSVLDGPLDRTESLEFENSDNGRFGVLDGPLEDENADFDQINSDSDNLASWTEGLWIGQTWVWIRGIRT